MSAQTWILSGLWSICLATPSEQMHFCQCCNVRDKKWLYFGRTITPFSECPKLNPNTLVGDKSRFLTSCWEQMKQDHAGHVRMVWPQWIALFILCTSLVPFCNGKGKRKSLPVGAIRITEDIFCIPNPPTASVQALQVRKWEDFGHLVGTKQRILVAESCLILCMFWYHSVRLVGFYHNDIHGRSWSKNLKMDLTALIARFSFGLLQRTAWRNCISLWNAAGFAVSLHSSPDSMALRDCISKVGAQRRKRTEAKTCQEKNGTSVHVENLGNKFFECSNP